jgi:hypothetical protein
MEYYRVMGFYYGTNVEDGVRQIVGFELAFDFGALRVVGRDDAEVLCGVVVANEVAYCLNFLKVLKGVNFEEWCSDSSGAPSS